MKAFETAIDSNKLALGVVYINPDKITFEKNLTIYKENEEPLCFRPILNKGKLIELINEKK